MAQFNSLKSLEAYIKKQINESLNDDVANTVKTTISEEVENTVYAAGHPVVYQRRGAYEGTGGLGDINEMTHKVYNGVLTVTDDAEAYYDGDNGLDGNKSLAENIEWGYGDRESWYNQGRPFIENSKDKLLDEERHISAMKRGLEKRGIDTL